jgi:hypothetical protein
MIALLFEDWFTNHFVPDVQNIVLKITFHLKPCLFWTMLQVIHESLNMQIRRSIFSCPLTTALLQLVDQELIASFTAYYLGWTFARLVEAVDDGGPTVKEFWKSFAVFNPLDIIKEV